MTQNGKTLFAMTNFGGIVAYDVATGERLPQSASTETESSFHCPYSLSFLRHSHDRIVERTRTWAVWDISTGRRTIIPQPPDRTKIDLSRDGTKTLEVDKDTIQIRDVASRAIIQQLPLRGLPELKHVAFSNDGTAVVGYSESAIVSINISSGKVDVKHLPKTVKFEYPTYADDGRRIAVFERGSIDNVIKSKLTIHDLNARQSEWKIEQPFSGVSSPFAFTRNDSLLLVNRYVRSSNSDNYKQYVDCYDVSTRKLRHRISDLNAYTVSPDGRFVLSTLPEYSLSIIEVATGKVRMSFQYPKFDSIWNAEFSPDSQRLATKMCSGVLYVWDLNTGEVPTTEPDEVGLENAWAGLGTIDAAIGFQAIRRLSKYPAKSLPFLAGKLSPASALNLDRVEVWLMQLDAPDYDTRRIAYRKLLAVSQQIEPQLISIRDSTESLELREKVQKIIDEQHLPNAENVRIVRAVEVVERIALDATAGFAIQAQAKAVLARWASGQAGAKLTDEAKFAIGRIKIIE